MAQFLESFKQPPQLLLLPRMSGRSCEMLATDPSQPAISSCAAAGNGGCWGMRYNLITGAEPDIAVGCWLCLSHVGGTELAGHGLLIALLKIMQKHEQWGFAVMKHFKCVSASFACNALGWGVLWRLLLIGESSGKLEFSNDWHFGVRNINLMRVFRRVL